MKKLELWLEQHISLHDNENPQEELANGWTHIAGAILSIIGMFILVRSGFINGSPRVITGFIIFSISMVLLFSASGFYHLAKSSTSKRLLRVLDHCNIYLLIAGTYTPILIGMNISLSNTLLIIIWSIALGGMLFSLFFWGRLKVLHILSYLAMGWMVVFLWDSLVASITFEMLKWIIAGGVTYTVGVIFYSLKKMPYSHAIWHLFVLCASGFFLLGNF